MKKLIPLCILIALVITLQSCKKKDSRPNVTVTVDGLFSLTGNWSTLGITSKAALELAADDINKYLKNENADFHLAVSFYDTKLDPDIAKQDFINAKNSKVHFIVGPQSSAELAAIQPLADASQVIVVSQSSTAGSLAIAGDPIFRYCPSDRVEGEAMAATITKDGIKGLVTLARNDAGNLGLQLATDGYFAATGGNVKALNAYSTTITDFSPVIASLQTQVAMDTATYGLAHTAVYLASFDECADLFKLAAQNPLLSRVKWYGGDGVALSAILTGNAPAADFAIKTGFFAPSFGLPPSLQNKWQPIADRIKAKTGITPDAFALSAYDAMWVIAHSLESENTLNINFTRLETLFADKSNSYTGITGSTALDNAGDRASGTFDYWGITKTDTTYSWNLVGTSGQ